MIKKIFYVYLLIFLTGCFSEQENKLTIATAANMQFVMKELVDVFSKETSIACQTIISSSGKLTAQIQEGAPFDVFVSADLKYPTELEENGFTLNVPKVYAKGRLVLWSLKDLKQPLVEVLENEAIQHIAIANSKTAPYGKAAVEVLESLGLYEKLEDKLVYGESIAQTNQFIISESAELGFTAKSVVLSPHLKDKGTWQDIPFERYQPIEQGVVLLNHAKESREEAQRFFDFLFSPHAKSILEKYGYQPI